MDSPHIDLVLPRLRCPACTDSLTREDRTVRCPAGHGFDLARQGYLTLLDGGRRVGRGDTADMVTARETFLARGHYAPIAEALARAVDAVPAVAAPGPTARATDDAPSPLVVDLAGGAGYYLAAVLDAQPAAVGLVLELSPYAVRRAARAHPRTAAVRADVWRPLPLATGSCAAVLSVFGPRNAAEIARVSAPGGRLVVVTPLPDHLAGLIEPLGLLAVDPDKEYRLARQLADFTLLDRHELRYRTTMTHEDARLEALMGPSAHHLDRAQLATSVARLLPETTDVTVAVSVTSYSHAS